MAERFTLDLFLNYKKIILDGPEDEQWETINKIRKASSIEEAPPLELIIQAEIIPILLTYHKGIELDDSILQDILWTLANIGSGNAQQTLYVVQQGAVEYFMEFMTHRSESVYGQALWGLANIGGESSKYRDLLLDKGVLGRTLDLYFKRKDMMKTETKRTIAWLVNNLCRNKPPVQYRKVEACLPYLMDSLCEIDQEIIIENLWACAYITEISEYAVLSLTNRGVMELVVAQLSKNIEKLTIVTPALKTCSNVVANNDELTQRLINLGVLPMIFGLMSNAKPIIRREACYFFSNVTAGVPSQIDEVFSQTNFLSTLMSILENDDVGVANEAVWIISNAVIGSTRSFARKMISEGVFIPILHRLALLGKKAQLMALQGFRALLNHVMNMADTPAPIIQQIKYYKDEVEREVHKQQEESLSRVLSDIDDLISDVLDNVKESDSNKPSSFWITNPQGTM